MITPLLSIIIPTYKRPQFLPRAIKSALQAAANGNVEIIIVPNGSDASWKSVVDEFTDESRVKWYPIETTHASAARNHGMKLAQGKYIRFLDDDDYFYVKQCQQQLDYQITNDLDISYAYIDSIDQYGDFIKKHRVEIVKDFIYLVFFSFSTPQHGYLYKKKFLENIFWDVSINKRQDLYWLFNIAIRTEPKFSVFPKTVGAWLHHEGPRVSKGHSVNNVSRETAIRALECYRILNTELRLNSARSHAISTRLWRCVHEGIMYDLVYWIKIACIAKKISKSGNPATPIYFKRFFFINPLLWEIFLIPFRWCKIICGHKYSN